MSYDFMMFEPRGTINAMADITASNLCLQNAGVIKEKLTRLFPKIEWENKGDRGWLGRLNEDGDAYEFRLPEGDDECWTINTAEENHDTAIVAKICSSLELLAFDGQALELIDASGRRPAA